MFPSHAVIQLQAPGVHASPREGLRAIWVRRGRAHLACKCTRQMFFLHICLEEASSSDEAHLEKGILEFYNFFP